MRIKRQTINESRAREIITKLITEQPNVEHAYRAETRNEYELLFDAADEGMFPDMLSITRKGLRLNKLLVHAPVRESQH